MQRMIIDTSSVVWTGLLAGKDEENGKVIQFNDKAVLVNSAEFGYEKAVGYLVETMKHLDMVPHQLIFVVEGKMSKSRRVAMYRDYKASRDSRPPEAYEQFNEAVGMVTEAFRTVGASVVSQDGVEGDDVIAYLAQNLDGVKVIVSNDGDLSALMSDDVVQVKSGTVIQENPIGAFPVRFIRLYKALVGDSSDNIKGAFKFGPKAFEKMYAQYGDNGLDAVEGMIRRKVLHEVEEDVGDFPDFRRVIDSLESVYQSYDVAGLYPEWCNTLRQPLQWRAGLVLKATDERLAPWGQKIRLVTAGNYVQALDFFRIKVRSSPVIGFDIETSTPFESDEWLRMRDKDEDTVDQFGSELTGFSLTFGNNGQYTYYVCVNHADTPNISVGEAAEFMKVIPPSKHVIIHNVAFELPVTYPIWKGQLEDKGWHGFVPNAIDTMIMSSYADENRGAGLKSLSEELLNYDQITYQEVTQGKKMRELTGEHVLQYGADDAICSVALYHHFRQVLEIERTWDVMLELEQKTSYLKAIAYVRGVPFSLQTMKEMEDDDKVEYERNWAVVRDFLIESGWHGTVTPKYETLDANGIKEIVSIVMPNVEFKTQVRTPSKLAILIRELDHPDADLVADLIENEKLDQINELVAARYSGEPIFDENSPKMMKEFLYDLLGLPTRIVNNVTVTERKKNPKLAEAVSRYKKIWAGSTTEPPLTKAEKELLRLKVKTNKTAVDFALMLDAPDHPVLKAFQRMKVCDTRLTMYYNAYRNLKHWKDDKIHGQAGQCRTVTRRDAPNSPNLAQLPKKGEGIKFRECFPPHHENAVVVSIDFAQQELRQGAGQSMDENMLACYVGDNLKDMHSMTAAGAMDKKWGKTKVAELVEKVGVSDAYDLFTRLRKSDEDEIAKKADDLRKSAKNVNFGAQYDAQAPKLAETLIIPVEDAEAFLQAKFAMFPRFEEWKEEVKKEAKKLGYVTTCRGARRHLRDSILSDNKWDVEKAMRQGPNFKIQGSSGEQTKLAQGRVWDSGAVFSLDMDFYFSVHDELVFSVHKDQVVEAVKIVHSAMTQPYGNLPVPFLGSISLGPNFGHQIELGEEIDEDKIRATVDSLFKEAA